MSYPRFWPLAALSVLASMATGCGTDVARPALDDDGHNGLPPMDDGGGALPARPDAGSTEPDAAGPLASCTPTFESYQRAEAALNWYCGPCHAHSPRFGAPFSLLGYTALLGTHEGEFIVDRIARALEEGRMPPAEQPQPDAQAREELLAFATCREPVQVHPGHGDPGQLTATREPLAAGDEPPVDAEPRDLTAQEFALPASAKDRYETFDFSDLVESDRFVRRFDPVIDDERVVHHLTLRFIDGRGYAYTWAPGGPSIQFPEGGIRIRPSDTLRLEIHYNNGVAADDVADSSGVRIWFGDTTGTEYGLANLATWDIQVPPGERSSATAHCAVEREVHVYAAAPHMHEIGDSFEHLITRQNGEREDLVSLTGWSFSAQRYYQVGVDLAPGDALDMRCNYHNHTGALVVGGPNTQDEMCFDFMYITPPDALDNCHDSLSL